mmetsp:Transcript_47142/g.152241  ORF Transcript_47142/g.152241 Transcript_47142/m.152241 type:complete len:330 (+) Transcript_47142:238-1227(+)
MVHGEDRSARPRREHTRLEERLVVPHQVDGACSSLGPRRRVEHHDVERALPQPRGEAARAASASPAGPAIPGPPAAAPSPAARAPVCVGRQTGQLAQRGKGIAAHALERAGGQAIQPRVLSPDVERRLRKVEVRHVSRSPRERRHAGTAREGEGVEHVPPLAVCSEPAARRAKVEVEVRVAAGRRHVDAVLEADLGTHVLRSQQRRARRHEHTLARPLPLLPRIPVHGSQRHAGLVLDEVAQPRQQLLRVHVWRIAKGLPEKQVAEALEGAARLALGGAVEETVAVGALGVERREERLRAAGKRGADRVEEHWSVECAEPPALLVVGGE